MDFQMPAAGAVVAWLFGYIDSLLVQEVGRTVGVVISTSLPFVTLFLTLSLTLQAMQIMRGAVQQPVSDFLWRAFKIAIVVSILAPGGMYMTEIVEVLLTAPADLAAQLSSATPNGESSTEYFTKLFDSALAGAARLGSEVFNLMSWMNLAQSVVMALIALIMVLAITALVILGVIIIALVKVAVGVLAAVGPFFIFALIFEHSKDMAMRWIAMITSFFLLLALFSIVAGMLLRRLTAWVEHIANTLGDNPGNLLEQALGVLVVTITSFVVLYMIPGWASTLTGSFGSNVGSAAGQAARQGSQAASAGARAASAVMRMLRR